MKGAGGHVHSNRGNSRPPFGLGLCHLTRTGRKIFKPCQNEKDSVKETGEKRAKSWPENSSEILFHSPPVFLILRSSKSFSRTFSHPNEAK